MNVRIRKWFDEHWPKLVALPIVAALYTCGMTGRSPWWHISEGSYMKDIEEAVHRGDFETAMQAVHVALARTPDDTELLYNAAAIERVRGNNSDALVYLAAYDSAYRSNKNRQGFEDRDERRANAWKLLNELLLDTEQIAHNLIRESVQIYNQLPDSMRPGLKLSAAEVLLPLTDGAPAYDMHAPAFSSIMNETGVLCWNFSGCQWRWPIRPWRENLEARRIELTHPDFPGCCTLSLDDSELRAPAESIAVIKQLSPEEAPWRLSRIGIKQKFLANYIRASMASASGSQ